MDTDVPRVNAAFDANSDLHSTSRIAVAVVKTLVGCIISVFITDYEMSVQRLSYNHKNANNATYQSFDDYQARSKRTLTMKCQFED